MYVMEEKVYVCTWCYDSPVLLLMQLKQLISYVIQVLKQLINLPVRTSQVKSRLLNFFWNITGNSKITFQIYSLRGSGHWTHTHMYCNLLFARTIYI